MAAVQTFVALSMLLAQHYTPSSKPRADSYVSCIIYILLLLVKSIFKLRAANIFQAKGYLPEKMTLDKAVEI